MRLFRLVLLLLAVLAGPASAAVTLRYAADRAGGLSMVIEADDAGNVRAEKSDGQVMIVRGAETYFVLPGHGGAVVRLEDALALVAEARVATGPPPAPERSRLVERGPERIGQWDGILYWIEPLPPVGQRLRSEIVIANDPALAAAGRAFARVEEAERSLFHAAFGSPDTNFPALAGSLFERGLVLRIGGRYRLESLGDAPVPASRFELPGPVLSRDQYRALLTR